MPALFCFIDDAAFELDMFRENAARAFGEARFVYAHTFEQALADMGGKEPCCFLLDLYGADPKTRPRLPLEEELADRLHDRINTGELFEGAKASGEGANLFLRKLHGLVARRQEAFGFAAGCLGQSSAFGLENLAKARKNFPLAAALAYSRKALYKDAAGFMAAGGDGVLQKPQGNSEQDIALATRQKAPDLALACRLAIRNRLAALSRLGSAPQRSAAARALGDWTDSAE